MSLARTGPNGVFPVFGLLFSMQVSLLRSAHVGVTGSTGLRLRLYLHLACQESHTGPVLVGPKDNSDSS